MKEIMTKAGLLRQGSATGLTIGIVVALGLAVGGVVLKGISRLAGEGNGTRAQDGPPLQFDLGGSESASNWRTNSIWYDGQAEYAVYQATRPIYGQAREYEAVLITNKQQMDPKTTTKSADWQAPGQIEVFKHNLREVVATENYDYKFLTTAFMRADDLRPFKLTMSSQEDCGATFKQFVANGKKVAVDTFVYFPNDGVTQLKYDEPAGFQFHDGLTLSLRGFPFDETKRQDGWAWSMRVLPDQTDTHATGVRPVLGEITYEGRETLSLPIGEVEAHQLKVVMGETGEASTYWFAADGGSEWLHILVKYAGPFGVEYELKSKRRWAYWERG